jgi:peptidoglycan hydrolase-like protein with peptidoglycan-binding domain
MKKIVKLTESDLVNIVKKVINEQLVNVVDTPKEIKQIQQKLVNLGYDLGPSGPNKDGVDGYIGRRTRKAIKDFQTKNNIKSTGVLDQTTQNALSLKIGINRQFNPNIIAKDNTRVVRPIDKSIINQNNKSTAKSDTLISKSTNPSFVKLISPKKLNTSSSTPIFPAGQDFCAQFINDFSDKFGYVGDAWIAHNNDNLGNRVFSSFTSLSPEQSKQAIDLWTKINKNGGGEEKGPFTNNVKQFVNQLVPSTPPTKLNLDDIVGIYYPKSGYHEKAFYDAGKPYFTEGPNKNMVPGNTIKSGKGWGMNTHLGIVGAIKNGVPIIFHNIHGQVYADPVGSLKDGGRVAWVRRPGSQAVSLNDKPSKSDNEKSGGFFGNLT